jgi:hypothetical protein
MRRTAGSDSRTPTGSHLVKLIVTPTQGHPHHCALSSTQPKPQMQEVCGTSDLGIGWGYVKQLEIGVMTARVLAAAYG